MLVIGIAGWLACSVVAWCLTMGAFTKRFPEYSNKTPASILAFFGPFGLFAAVLVSASNSVFGWRFIPLTKAESWASYHAQYPMFSYEQFEASY